MLVTPHCESSGNVSVGLPEEPAGTGRRCRGSAAIDWRVVCWPFCGSHMVSPGDLWCDPIVSLLDMFLE